MLRICCLTLLFMVVLGGGLADTQVRFASGVNTVAAYVTVLNRDGQPVPRLSVRDFEVLDEGKPRQITSFEAGMLPITIVLLIDDSPSMRASKPSTIMAGAALTKRLLPQDRATVGVFSRTVRIEGNLTSDQDELVNRLQDSSPLMAGTAMWDAMNAAMAVLEEEGGRRVVLVLTDGDDNTSETSAASIADRAAREGVIIYAIGIKSSEGRISKGLQSLGRDSGGAYIELKGHDNLARATQSVADELHSQYLLGFQVDALDGRVHRLEIKVKRGGITVRARKSYVASQIAISSESVVSGTKIVGLSSSR